MASIAAPFVVPRLGFAQRSSPTSAPDPGTFFNEWSYANQQIHFNVHKSKTARAITIANESTLIMFVAGQSLALSIITDTFTPTNGSKIDNYCWYDGKNYVAANPLIGAGGDEHNFNLKIADGLISNGKFARVILVPVALSGVTIQYYVSDAYKEIVAAAKKLAAQGITTATPNVKFLVKWNQGESDTRDGTTQQQYTDRFSALYGLVSPHLPGAKWMVAKETRYIGTNSAAIQAAQMALVNGTTIFAGEDMDSIPDSSRNPDQTHLNATGGNSAATMGIAAISAITF
ncbi:sialate O-acetylesterase [Bradyrhizobium icense]|nr:sialate O-acetylesterase [Bradyrhizobium icense]